MRLGLLGMRRRWDRLNSSMAPSLPRVPAHLRKYVVEQDYDAYNTIDQAVWRFVLLQVNSRLAATAHPAYQSGLEATGISLEEIPRIAEMNERLAAFGWGAVCVDGFIPPRAFQEFQAHALLPIAGEIRTRGHLVYTPAPDIIHEAAGHAPILPEPAFAAYVKRIGTLGRRAFALPEEKRVYEAIYQLSEAKENPELSAEEVSRAESALAEALHGVQEASEVTRLSRLYWWTAEYGLVGSLEEYKLYGAGLLSSLWESHTCHAPSVRKLPLDVTCMDVDYDITKPQPQLFVAASFAQLHEVLDQAERTLAAEIGGELALRCALASQELASVRFSSGLWVMGVLRGVAPSLRDPGCLTFGGPVAFAWNGAMDEQGGGFTPGDEHRLVTGRLEGGSSLDELRPAELERFVHRGSGRHRFAFDTGVEVAGRLERVMMRTDGRVSCVVLTDVRIAVHGQPPIHFATHWLWAAGTPLGAEAGAVDARYHAETSFPEKRVPVRRRLSKEERSLLKLYEQAEHVHHERTPALPSEFSRIHAELHSSYPAEWLLRWNLLESLLKAHSESPLRGVLTDELQALEARFEGREPITSGLHYLSELRSS